MSLPKLPTAINPKGPDDINQRRRRIETLNGILDFSFDDSRVRTAAEISASVTPVNYAYAPDNALRQDAGAADSADAFNRASFATYAGWVPPLVGSPGDPPRLIRIPAGRYAPVSTTYVRSGGAILGDGMATLIDASGFGVSANDVFRMGYGLIAGVPTLDSGGYPPEVANMFFNGGPSGGGACIRLDFPGGTIHDCWFAGAGLGVYLAGGYVYDCEFDIGLVGVTIGPSTNQRLTNCGFFNDNFCVSFDVGGGDIADALITDCTFEYPKYAAIIMGAGTGHVRGLKVANCIFTNNADYATYIALVSIGNTDCHVEFENCTFRNWKNYAFVIAATGGVVILKNCTFDGAPTHSTYASSSTSSGISFSLGTLIIKDCIARNLDGTFLDFSGSSAATVDIDGLSYESIGGSWVIGVTNSNTSSRISLRNIKGDGVTRLVQNQSVVPLGSITGTLWFGPIATSGASHFVLVPYQRSSLYMMTLTANQNAGVNANYRKSRCDYVEKDNEFNGAFNSFIVQATVVQGAANTNGLLTLTAEFGAVGGTATIAESQSGDLAISWPNTYSSESIDVQLIQSG